MDAQLSKLIGLLEKNEVVQNSVVNKLDQLTTHIDDVEKNIILINERLNDLLKEHKIVNKHLAVSENQVKFFQDIYEDVKDPLAFACGRINSIKGTVQYLTGTVPASLPEIRPEDDTDYN